MAQQQQVQLQQAPRKPTFDPLTGKPVAALSPLAAQASTGGSINGTPQTGDVKDESGAMRQIVPMRRARALPRTSPHFPALPRVLTVR